MRSRLRPGERVELIVRRHPIRLAGPALVPLFLSGALGASFLRPEGALRIVAGAALLASVAGGLWKWLEWRADLWAVTTQRVIDESGVLTVRMMDSPLEIIQNVACEQSIFGRTFGFGKVVIQTAAAHGEVALDGIAHPDRLRDAILDMKERRRTAGSAPAPATRA
jgi:membrane protein YdbS with pleckstrin-like domain